MGCHCARDALFSSEAETEKSIMMHQTALGYAGVPASDVMNAANAYSKKGRVLQKQLINVMDALSLPISQFEMRSGPMFTVYRLLTESKAFTVKKLSTVGLLLGSGSAEDKAQILYALYEGRETQSVAEKEVRQMLVAVCDIAFVFVPKYVELEMAEFNNLEGLKKLEKFTNRLKQRRGNLDEIILEAILGGEESVKRKKFVSNVCANCPYLLSAHELRWFTVSISSETPYVDQKNEVGASESDSSSMEPGDTSMQTESDGDKKPQEKAEQGAEDSFSFGKEDSLGSESR